MTTTPDSMTAVFANNYLEDIPVDLQMKICDMSKCRWRLDCNNLDTDKFCSYMKAMIKKDMSKNDDIKYDSIMELQKKLSSSIISFQFANQKLSEAINNVLKYQDEFDFDLYDLLSNIKLQEKESFLSLSNYYRIYDWDKNEYITNPDYESDSDLEYSSDED